MVVRRKTQKCYCSTAVYSLWSVFDSDDDEDGGTEEETEVLLFYSCLFLVVCA